MSDDEHVRQRGGHRKHGGGWIAGSIVAIVVGWYLALASVLSTAGPWSNRWPDVGMLVAYLIAAALGFGVPLWGFTSLRREGTADPSVSMVGPTVCLLVLSLGGVTLLPLPLVQGSHMVSDAVERAQPPTARETARTVPQAQEELAALGDRVVVAMGGDPAAPAAETETDSCRLGNQAPGTMVRYSWWRGTADDGPAAGAAPDDAATPAEPPPSPSATVPDAEGVQMSAPAVELLEDEGYHVYQRYDGGGGRLTTDAWRGSATVGQRGASLLLESGCLVDPDAVDEDQDRASGVERRAHGKDEGDS